MKGVYVLFSHAPYEFSLKISDENVTFKQGYYAYVGSALGGIEKRVGRHFSNEKKLHWHIDHFLLHAKAVDVIAANTDERMECKVADGMAKVFQAVRGFGASDCNCESHLFYSKDLHDVLQGAIKVFKEMGLKVERGVSYE
ncbi:MAG: GIY-YIG nuclease family protein [Candidatus Hadarchaeota archaeon]